MHKPHQLLAYRICAVVLLALGTVTAIASNSIAWSQSGHDAQHTACSSYTVQAPPLTSAWTFPLSHANSATQLSHPIIGANGTIFAVDDNSTIYALDSATGVLLWSFTTGGGNSNGNLPQSPAIDARGVVYAGFVDGSIYALDGTTGMRLWNYTTRPSPEGIATFMTAPAVANGIAYAASGYPRSLYAFNCSTGVPLWTFSLVTLSSGILYSAPSVDAEGHLFITPPGAIVALNSSTGAYLWGYDTLGYGDIASAVISNDGIVFVAATEDSTYLYAINGSTGVILWGTLLAQMGGNAHMALSADGTLFVAADELFAFNSAGTQLWNTTLYSGAPIVDAAGTVFVPGAALNGSDGEFKWLVAGSPSAIDSDGTLYVTNSVGKLSALRAPPIPTMTATATVTSTRSAVSTGSQTATQSPSETFTGTHTPSASATHTAATTPAPTITSSRTASRTPSTTRTSTKSTTGTRTSTKSRTTTATSTRTTSNSRSSSRTASATRSTSGAGSSSRTASASPKGK